MKTGKSTLCSQSWSYGIWERRNYIRKIRIMMIVRDRRPKVVWAEWMIGKKKTQWNILLLAFVSVETNPILLFLEVRCSQFWLIFLDFFFFNLSIAILGCFFISCLREIKYLPCTCAKERILLQYFPHRTTCRGFSVNICETGIYSTQEN